MTGSILEKIRAAENLPSLPMVAVQVLRLSQSDASISGIATVIEKDPALASKILKVANSSLFGMPRQISSVQQAMVILGLRTVKVLALTFSLVEAVQNQEAGGFDHQAFWRTSLTNAVSARLLAHHLKSPQPDEAFVTALLTDIGMLAAFHADRQAYREVLAESASRDLPVHVVEQERFGATHEFFSSQLLDAWGLPDKMVAAVARHHQPHDDTVKTNPEPGDLVRIVAAAVMIGDMFCSPRGPAQLAEVSIKIPQIVPISALELQVLLHLLNKQVQQTAATCAIDIGPTRSYKDLQAEAVVQLAKLTMATELERAQLAAREQELSNQNRSLARKAATDGLTGIANRIALEEHLDSLCRTVVPEGRTIGMLLLDIDRFKKLNDTFGHQTGDTALSRVGEYLRAINSPRHFTARYGGEELAVVVCDTTLGELSQLAEKIRLDIQQIRFPFNGRYIALTVSVGGAILDSACGDPTPNTLVSHADRCLYQAKEGGRNRAICGENHAGVSHLHRTPPRITPATLR